MGVYWAGVWEVGQVFGGVGVSCFEIWGLEVLGLVVRHLARAATGPATTPAGALGGQTVFFNVPDLHHKPPDSGERQCKSTTF